MALLNLAKVLAEHAEAVLPSARQGPGAKAGVSR